MIDWNDYRLILLIARSGRVSEASLALRVAPSTVFRRLERIEAQLETAIFYRDKGTYTPTEFGTELILSAEQMEQATARIERRITSHDQRLSGTVTIATSEVLAAYFVARHVGKIGSEHPNLTFRILGGSNTLSLANREADLAIRPVRPDLDTLFGRKLATIRWAHYSGAPNGRKGQEVGFVGEPRIESAFGEPARDQGGHQAQYAGNSLVLNARLAEGTGGTTLLPMILGEQCPGLTKVADAPNGPTGELWIVCHEDLRRNARVRVVFDAMIEAARADRTLFEGSDH